MCIVSLAFNTDTKIYDAQGRIVLESSTGEIRIWKENQATESEADVGFIRSWSYILLAFFMYLSFLISLLSKIIPDSRW